MQAGWNNRRLKSKFLDLSQQEETYSGHLEMSKEVWRILHREMRVDLVIRIHK
jgi:hypothetical protein